MRPEKEVDPAIPGECLARDFDRLIAGLAERQHGTVTRWQLLDLGLSSSAIDRRVASGRLHILYRGVYAVGDRCLPPLGHLAAAVYATGRDAVASHRSAAALHGIRAYTGAPEVTGRPGSKAKDGIHLKQALLQPDEITVVAGIRVTTAARTLLDLGAMGNDIVEKAVRQAEFLALFDLAEVSRLLERYPNRRGTARLREAIRVVADSEVRTRSDMETSFWTLVLDANLPEPEMNGTIELGAMTIEADAIWRDAKLIVELDSRQAHATRHGFENDRERDRIAALRSWLVIRVTWRQLNEQPERIVDDVRRLLEMRTRS